MARVLLILITSLMLAGAARADVEQAKQLYADGRTQYNLGDYRAALDLFKRAYEAHNDSAFLFNIAQCERALGRYDDAERSYRAYLRESPNLPEQRISEVKVLIGAMASAAQQQRANLPPPGTEPPRAAPEPAAAQHSIATEPVQAVSTQATPRKKWYASPVGWSLVGIGVASAAVGGALLALAGHQGDLASAATTPDAFDSHHASDLNFQKGGWPVLAFGATAIVVGGVVMAVGQRRKGN